MTSGSSGRRPLAVVTGASSGSRALDDVPVEVLVNDAGLGGRGRFAVERDVTLPGPNRHDTNRRLHP